MFRKLLTTLKQATTSVLYCGVAREDIERGQVLAKPATITPHTKFKAEVYVLSKKKADVTLHSSLTTVLNSTSVQQTLLVL